MRSGQGMGRIQSTTKWAPLVSTQPSFCTWSIPPASAGGERTSPIPRTLLPTFCTNRKCHVWGRLLCGGVPRRVEGFCGKSRVMMVYHYRQCWDREGKIPCSATNPGGTSTWEDQTLPVREWRHRVAVSSEILWLSDNLVDAKVLLFIDFSLCIFLKKSFCVNLVICFRIRQTWKWSKMHIF